MDYLTHLQLTRLRRRQSPNWIATRYLMFMLGLNVALVPLWFYIAYERGVTLLMLTAIISTTHFLVLFRTMHLSSLNLGRGASSELELIALTGITAWKLIYSKWIAVMQFVWKDMLLFALLRLGLAIGVAEYLHTIPCAMFTNNLLCYQSYSEYPWVEYYANYYRYLSFGHILIGAIVLSMFSVLETGLSAAIGILVSCKLRKSSSAIHLALTGLTRISIALMGVLGWRLLILSTDLIRQLPRTDYQWTMELKEKFYLTYFFKYSQLSSLSLADSGTILSAQFMRPSWGVFTNIVFTSLSALEAIVLYVVFITLILFLSYLLLIRRGFTRR